MKFKSHLRTGIKEEKELKIQLQMEKEAFQKPEMLNVKDIFYLKKQTTTVSNEVSGVQSPKSTISPNNDLPADNDASPI